MASPRGDCYPYSRTEACSFQGTVFTIRAGDRTRRPLRSWLMRCGIETPVRWFQGTPLLATCRFCWRQDGPKEVALGCVRPENGGFTPTSGQEALQGANGCQSCFARWAGTIFCAPRIIGWSCVKLIGCATDRGGREQRRQLLQPHGWAVQRCDCQELFSRGQRRVGLHLGGWVGKSPSQDTPAVSHALA